MCQIEVYPRDKYRVFQTSTPFEVVEKLDDEEIENENSRQWIPTVDPSSYIHKSQDEFVTFYISESIPKAIIESVEFQECTTGDWCEDDYTKIVVFETIIVYCIKD